MFKNRATLRSRILSVAVISALGVTGAAVAATAVQRPVGVVATPAAQFGVLTRATTLGHGDVVKSAVPLSQSVHVTVTLKLRDEAGMKTFLSQPSHGVMSQAQLANHLPTQAQAQAVANYLRGAGFTNIKISANR